MNNSNNYMLGVQVKAIVNAQRIQSEINKQAKNLKITANLTPMQKQIEAFAKTQRNVMSSIYSGTGRSSYSDWWKKTATSMDTVANRSAAASRNFSQYLKGLNTRDLKNYSTQINEISSAFTKASITGNRLDLSNANAKLSNFKSTMQEAGMATNTFTQQIGYNIRRFAQWTISATALMQAIRAVRNTISTVFEMDKTLTNIRMVTGDSIAETQDLIVSYNGLAKELGATTAEVTTSANEWLRMGKTVDETNTLIKNATILSKIAQLESADATQYMTSAMLGYKVAVEDTLYIADMLSSVDMESATSAGGLAEGMSRTAASANLAGVEMNKLISYLAVVGEVTQKSMESVGESFKTIFARMGNVKLGKLEDEDGNDISSEISDVEKVLNKVDIKLRDSASTFRDFDDVLDDVGDNWSKFSEVEQSAIATTFAGVRQRENFIVLMDNYSNALKYAETASNSSGTATEKFAMYQESASAKAKELTASLESLAMNTLNSSIVKGFLDGSQAVATFIDKTHLLNIALSGLGIFGAFKIGSSFLNWITKATASMSAFGTALTTVKTINNLNDWMALSQAIKGLSLSQAQAVISTQAYTVTVVEKAMVTAGYTAEEISATTATLGLSSAQGVATGTTFALGTALKGLWVTLAANPLTWVIAAAGALYGLVKLVDLLNTSSEEHAEKINELKQEYDDLQTEIEELNGKLETTQERIDELLEKDTLTLTEQEELDKLQNANEMLQSQVDLLKEQAKLKAADTNKAVEDWSNDFFGYSGYTQLSNEELMRSQMSTLEDLYSRYYSLSDTEQKKLAQFQETIQGYATEIFENIEDYSAVTPEQEKQLKYWQDFYQELVKLSGYDTYISVDSSDAKESADELNEALSQTEQTVSTALSSLSSLSDGMKLLDSAYASLIKNEPIEITDLIDIQDKFAGVEGLDEFINLASTAKSVTPELQSAFDNLVTSYINGSDALKNVTESTKDAVVAQLEQMGVSNAEEIVFARLNQQASALAKAKEILGLSTEQLENMTWDEVNALLSSANASDVSKQALAQYYASKITANGIVLNTSSDINNLLQLAKAAGVAISAINQLNQVKALQAKLDNPKLYGTPTMYELNALDRMKSGVSSTLSSAFSSAYLNSLVSTNYSGGSSTKSAIESANKGSSKEDTTDYWKQAFDNQLATLKHNLEMNYISEAAYYNQLDSLNKTYFANRSEYLSEYRQYEEEVYKGLKQLQEDAISDIDKLVDMRIDMIKDLKQAEIDAIDATIEKEKEKLEVINANIDARRKELEGVKELEDYQKELADKNKSVSDLQIELERLKYDNSAWGTKRRRELEEQLAEAQTDLSNYIKDHEYEVAMDKLDTEQAKAEEEYSILEENLNSQKELIETYLDDQAQLYQDAMTDINGMNQSLLEQMKNWAMETTGSVYDVVNAWNDAYSALSRYNGVNNVSGTYNNLQNGVASAISTTPVNSGSSGSPSGSNSSASYKAIHTIQKGDTLWDLAVKYYGSGTQWTKIQSANGGVDPKRLQIGGKLYIPAFHDGGIFDSGILKKAGEDGIVLARNGEGFVAPEHVSAIRDLMANLKPINNLVKLTTPNINNSQSPSIVMGDIIIQGNATQDTVNQLKSIQKDLTNSVLKEMQKIKTKSGNFRPAF